jgi:hypothetical protein
MSLKNTISMFLCNFNRMLYKIFLRFILYQRPYLVWNLQFRQYIASGIHAPLTTPDSMFFSLNVCEPSATIPDVTHFPPAQLCNIDPIPLLIHCLTDKFFAHCPLHRNPLVQQRGNYTLADLTDLHRAIKSICAPDEHNTEYYLAKSNCLAAYRQGQGDIRLTLTPSAIPNSNYVIVVSDWNCLKYLWVFLYCNLQVYRHFWSPYTNNINANIRNIYCFNSLTVSRSFFIHNFLLSLLARIFIHILFSSTCTIV